METNELPEDVKRKINEAVAKVYQATAIRFPLRTTNQVHAEQAEAIAEIYRLGLQSCEEDSWKDNRLRILESLVVPEEVKNKIIQEAFKRKVMYNLPQSWAVGFEVGAVYAYSLSQSLIQSSEEDQKDKIDALESSVEGLVDAVEELMDALKKSVEEDNTFIRGEICRKMQIKYKIKRPT